MNTEPSEPKDSVVTPSSATEPVSGPVANKKLSKRKLIGGLFLVIVFLGLIGGIFYSQRENKNNPTNNIYDYGDTSTFLMPGTNPGQGLSFEKPSVFDKSTEKETSKSEKGFVHSVPKPESASKKIILSRILTSSIDAAIVATEDYQKALNVIFSAKETDLGYIALEKNIEQYVRKAFNNSDSINVEISRPKAYTNNNVKSNAWVFEVTVTDKSDASSTQKGNLVYLVGKSARYYFLVTAESENWQANKADFEKVTQSLKINL